ncbi:MAG: hypothetical protein P8R03_06305, partial [Candidatus Poseidoniaceae archaeon]|nr:hypothetical protein [Candidatus Poseidoniaceae archaeon]
HFPHIMRAVIPLGDVVAGSMDVQLPAAFDGNDLSVHLVYQFNPVIEVVEEPEEPFVQDKDSASLPFIHSLTTIAMIGAAAYARRW